jgi:hypothetical protein
MPFSLTDHQLELVMTAAAPLDPSKRATLMARIAVHLRLQAAAGIGSLI